MNFDKYLFRCSALGHLMASDKGKDNYTIWLEVKAKHEKLTGELSGIKQYDSKGNTMKSYKNKVDAINKALEALTDTEKYKDIVVLSEGAKTHLMDIWISETKRRKADVNNKYIEKGLAMEEDGITLFSRIKKTMFKKNEQPLVNGFIKGTPDLFIGESIGSANTIIDIKCSWNANTFYRTFTKGINNLYYWQGIGYMWLTGARNFNLAYCLVNTPESLIEAEKRQLWYKLGQPQDDNENWLNACSAIERNMIYDDIPLREKMLEYSVEYSQSEIDLLTKKIIAAREYLNWLDNEFTLKFAQ